MLLHGHTHRYTHVLNGQQLMFNPGECAGMMPDLNAIGLVDLITLEAKVIRF
jgi:predicted phosphodiesterase